jgi:glycosyltransferase involved in cell wall biosynthesis
MPHSAVSHGSAPALRVSVASFTGTHPLDLARELHKAGVLDSYHCALPRFRVPGLPRDRVRTCPLVLAPHAALQWAGLGHLGRHLNRMTIGAYDRWLCRVLTPCDVFHVPSSYGLSAIRRAKSEYGALTVCDRGSSHIRVQAQILREERDRSGIRTPMVPRWTIEKEETEYAEADTIFVPSSFAYRTFVEAGVPPGKVVVIPYGVRLEEYFPTQKRDETFRMLCVAALSVRKGIQYLLEATSGLSLPNSEVVLRGAWETESRAVLAPFAGRYRLHPPVARAQLADLYSQASVLVLPSVEDGFGLVITQAMACGVPVIATTHSGGPDVITDGRDGFIVPPRSAAAIAERLQFLYNHPEQRAAMGRAALDKVRGLGGWAQYAAQVVRTYRSRLPVGAATRAVSGD